MTSESVNDCTSKIVEPWTFAFNVLNVMVLWWIVPLLVKLWERKLKLGDIFEGIVVSSFQQSLPGPAGHYAIRMSTDHEDRLSLYCNGAENHKKVPWYMVLFYVILDAVFAVLPAFSLATRRHDNCDLSDSLPMLWLYPSVPAAIFRLWIILDVKLLKLSKGWSFFGCYVALIGVGCGLLIPVWLTYMGTGDSTFYYLPILAYSYMCVPGSFFIGADPRKWILCVVCAALALAARTVPVAYSAFNNNASTKLPVPGWVNQQVFAVIYSIFGVVCTCLGLFYFCALIKPMKEFYRLRDERNKEEREKKKAEKKKKKAEIRQRELASLTSVRVDTDASTSNSPNQECEQQYAPQYPLSTYER